MDWTALVAASIAAPFLLWVAVTKLPKWWRGDEAALRPLYLNIRSVVGLSPELTRRALYTMHVSLAFGIAAVGVLVFGALGWLNDPSWSLGEAAFLWSSFVLMITDLGMMALGVPRWIRPPWGRTESLLDRFEQELESPN